MNGSINIRWSRHWLFLKMKILMSIEKKFYLHIKVHSFKEVLADVYYFLKTLFKRWLSQIFLPLPIFLEGSSCRMSTMVIWIHCFSWNINCMDTFQTPYPSQTRSETARSERPCDFTKTTCSNKVSGTHPLRHQHAIPTSWPAVV